MVYLVLACNNYYPDSDNVKHVCTDEMQAWELSQQYEKDYDSVTVVSKVLE